jgi:Protein of unknown function (DUF998)
VRATSTVRPETVVAAPRRFVIAMLLCVPGIIAYNWWAIVPFRPGLLQSVNSFFSDLEVKGARDAALFGRLDVLAGTLFLLALVLSRRPERERRWEWALFVTFAAAAAAGGLFPFSCAEGTDPACRTAEWHFELPVHHYMHVVLSAVEFLSVTAALLLARRRTRRGVSHPVEARAFRWLAAIVVVGYLPLAVAYFSDRLAALVEPVYFIAFSLATFTEVAGAAWEGRRSTLRSPSEAAARRASRTPCRSCLRR